MLPLFHPWLSGSPAPYLSFTCPKDCVFGACSSGAEKKGTLIPLPQIQATCHFNRLHQLACPSDSLLSDPPSPPSGGRAPYSTLPANTQVTQIRLSFRVYLGC